MNTCGHIGCHKPFSECPGHSCARFYRAGMGCEELDAFLLKWVRFNSELVIDVMATEGILWAVQQQAERDEGGKVMVAPIKEKRDPGWGDLTDVQKAFYEGYDAGYEAAKRKRPSTTRLKKDVLRKRV